MARYVHVVETGEPLVLDDWSFPQDVLAGELRLFDVRAVRVGDGLSQTWRDITDRHAAAAALAMREEQFRLLADNASDVVMRLLEERIVWVSPSVESALGGEPGSWVGISLEELLHPDDLPEYLRVREEVAVGAVLLWRARLRARDGAYHWVESHAGPYRRADGSIDGTTLSMRVIDAQVAAERDLERLAKYDTLTGALTRAEALDRLVNRLATNRQPGSALGLLFCDVDSFKAVNDTYGHAVGDAVLAAVARRLAASVRREDVVARMGGDELLVLLTGLHGLDEAVAVAEKARVAVRQPIRAAGVTLSVSLSIGAVLAVPGEGADALIARADQAMYRAKQAGRNQVVALPR